MKATLFASALALASTAFALPQGPPPPQTYKGGNSGGNTEDSPVGQGGNGPPPSYGDHSGSIGGSPQGIQPNQAGSGGQPGGGIGSPFGQNGVQPQGTQPQGNQGNLPGSLQPFQNGNNNQQPGNAIGSPVGGTQPQGNQPQGLGGANNQPQVGGGGQLPPGVTPDQLGNQPGRGGVGGSPQPQQFGQYQPNGQSGNGQPGQNALSPQGQQPGQDIGGLGPQIQQPGQSGGVGSPQGLSPQSNQQPGAVIGSPQGLSPQNNQQPGAGIGSPTGLGPQNGQQGNLPGQQPGQTGGLPSQQNGVGSPQGLSPQNDQLGNQPGIGGPQPGQMGSPQGISPQNGQLGSQPGISGPQPGQPGSGIGSPIGGSGGQLGQPPLGAPTGDNICGPSAGGNCVSQQEAELFIQRFISIVTHQSSDLGDAQTTAEQIIGEDWVEYSNSILSLQGLPLTSDGIAAHSKQEWTQGILNAPPFGGVQTLKLLVFCDQVLWYWNFNVIGSGEYPVKGFNLFTLRRQGNEVVASEVDIEFDSIAWGLDTGFSVTLRDGRTLPEGGASQQGASAGGQLQGQGQGGVGGGVGGSAGGGGFGGAQLGVGGQNGVNAGMGANGVSLGVGGQNGLNAGFAGAGASGPGGGVGASLSQTGGGGAGAGGNVGGGANANLQSDSSAGGAGGARASLSQAGSGQGAGDCNFGTRFICKDIPTITTPIHTVHVYNTSSHLTLYPKSSLPSNAPLIRIIQNLINHKIHPISINPLRFKSIARANPIITRRKPLDETLIRDMRTLGLITECESLRRLGGRIRLGNRWLAFRRDGVVQGVETAEGELAGEGDVAGLVCWDEGVVGWRAHSGVVRSADNRRGSTVAAADITFPFWEEEKTGLVGGRNERRESGGRESQHRRESCHFESELSGVGFSIVVVACGLLKCFVEMGAGIYTSQNRERFQKIATPYRKGKLAASSSRADNPARNYITVAVIQLRYNSQYLHSLASLGE
ncbi:hypothetical protein M409DRAFT_56716 [Zasmidium cellare ATCC 36951]|uniref:NTF2-like domain-containing protein n=1 Tax=Zasmidium cellare ATCC 36951 TaxID=1080233 RepID=A0A6A6CBC5_ZASCE|nr:uncharacterized protein M409DRAFT_56716 [Zasmidium cellare ATCC 36951]KAF2164454.1 hypothetical protein M409DRAFT_56716 [Zasmidium cellare ATCC 36951]